MNIYNVDECDRWMNEWMNEWMIDQRTNTHHWQDLHGTNTLQHSNNYTTITDNTRTCTTPNSVGPWDLQVTHIVHHQARTLRYNEHANTQQGIAWHDKPSNQITTAKSLSASPPNRGITWHTWCLGLSRASQNHDPGHQRADQSGEKQSIERSHWLVRLG